MTYLLPLGGLALANFLGIISPGPAFVMVTRAAAGQGRGAGLGLAMGVAIAASSWAAAACFGIVVLIAQFSSVYHLLQLAGGAYLIWLGIAAWRVSAHATPAETATATPAPAAPIGIARSVLVGAMLSLGNPKIVIFFSSIFVALLPVHAPLWVRLVAVAIVGVQEVSWYVAVAFLFSRPKVQAGYRRMSKWIERVMGTVLIGFGARILTTVRI